MAISDGVLLVEDVQQGILASDIIGILCLAMT
jgi:hypothetical protein